MNWEDIKRGIFAGESGGDYNALYGYSNRPGGQFSGTKVTDMTLDEALNFSNPSGAYGQAVKSQIGRVATPMGAYQVVGTTLRDAKKGLGLTGTEKFTPELQDRIGKYIYETQGTGAWAGYKGPKSGGSGDASMDNLNQPQPRQGLLGGQGIGSALGMSEDFIDRLKIAVLSGSDPTGFASQISSIQEGMQGRKAEAKASDRRNKTAAVLRQQGQGKIADLLEQGLISGTDAASQLLKEPEKPKIYSEFAKLNADLQAGNISKDQYDASVQSFLNKNKMSIRSTPDGGFEFVQGASAEKPQTDAQSKNIGFYKRSSDALELFNPVADSLVDSFGAAAELDPTGLARYFQSDEYQQAQVLGKDFLAPILRKDTGAAVTPSEWVFYKAIYIPEVGDNPAKLAEKKAARARAVEAMRIGLEPSQIVKLEGVDPATAPGLEPVSDTKIDLKFNPATGELEPV